MAVKPAVEIPPGDVIESWFEEITPEKALELLEKQSPEVRNRSVSESRVDLMARTIIKGEWKSTHQGIALDSDGFLLDGQHRLWAIVKAKRPIWLLVSRGVSRGDMNVIDRGRSRSMGDILAIDGVKHGAKKAAIMLVLGAFIRGKGDGDPRYGRLTDAEIRSLVEKYSESLEWWCGIKARAPFGRAPLAACFVFTHIHVPVAVNAVAEKFILGTHLTAGDPMQAMRNHIIRNTTEAYQRHFHMRMALMRGMFNAIAKSLQGKELSRINSDSIEGFEYINTIRRAS